MNRSVSTSRDQAEGRESCKRREEILDAATSLFAEHGFSEAVTQLLADRLQVGKGTIYRYFPSKRALFLAAADRVMRRVYERMEDSIRGVADPLDRVAAAVRAYLEFFAEHPEYVEVLIQERAQFKDRAAPTYFVHREQSVARWHELYRGLIAEGRLRPMPVERISGMFSAALYGAIFLNYFGVRAESPAAQAEDILDVIFSGILSEPERRKRGADPADEPPSQPSGDSGHR